MNESLTLREALEQFTNEELEVIMQEQVDSEITKTIPEQAELRKLAIKYLGCDFVIQMDRVASEAFRVYALRAAGM